MKNLVRLFGLVAAGALLAGSVGCGRTDIFGSSPKTGSSTTVQPGLTVTPATDTLGTGRAVQFSATVTPPHPTDQIQWTVVTPMGGSITAGGLYSAPATLPSQTPTNFPVTIRASLVGSELTADAHIIVVPVAPLAYVNLEKVSGDNQMGFVGAPLPAPFVVKAIGPDGKGVSALAIHFASPLATGSADAVTAADGTATATVHAGETAGPESFIVGGANVLPVSFRATIGIGALAKLIATDPSPSGLAGTTLAAPLTLSFRDQFGNPLSGRSAVVRPPNGATATPMAPVSDASGNILYTIQLGPTPGVQDFVFSDSQFPTISTHLQFIATGTMPASLILVSGDNQSGPVGSTVGQPFVVEVLDGNGQPVAGAPISWSTMDGGRFTQEQVVTDTSGHAAATAALGTKAGFQRFVVDGGAIANSPLTILVQANAGPATQLILEGGQGQTTAAGAQFGTAFSVLAADQFGNPVAGVPVTFSVVGGGGSIFPPVATTGADGLAQATMHAGAAGGNEVYQAASGNLMNSPITLTLMAMPNPITLHIHGVSGNMQTGQVGQPLPQPIVVEVLANGQPAPNVTVTFGVTQGGGSITPITVTTGADGMAKAVATLGPVPGPNAFTVSVTGADDTPLSFSETAVGQVVAGLKIISGNGQSAPPNSLLPQPVVVEAIDAAGMPVPNAAITFTAPPGAQVGTPMTTTDGNGQASSTVTLGSQIGDETFIASAGNVTVTFRESATMVIEILKAVSGDGQTAQIGQMLPMPLVVQLTDETGKPVSGVAVQWMALAQGMVSSASVMTDANGLAQVTAQLGTTVGSDQFTASVSGATGSPVAFTETATPAPPAQLIIVSGNNQNALVGSMLASPLVVRVVDAFGNGVSGVPVNWNVTAGGGTLSTMSTTTAADGTASVNASVGPMAGPNTYVADAGMLTGSPATFQANASTAMITSISITPTDQTANMGASINYSAVAIMSDGTTQVVTDQVTWSSSNPMVASISNTMGAQGIALATGSGTTTIQATLNGISGSTTLTVQGMTKLVSITITPAPAALSVGTTLQLTASGTYSDGSVSDITQSGTWTTADGTIASVGDAAGTKGLATGVAKGQTMISVSLNGVTASATISVIQSNLNNLQITPPVVSAPPGTTIDFHATATFADGTVQDVTSQAQWSTSDATHLTIDNAPDSGVAHLLLSGTVTITATVNGMMATETVTITNATLTSLTVQPNSLQLALKDVGQLTVTGIFSDGSSYDLTTSAVWSSSNSSTAAVSNAPGSQGVVTGVGTGSATITATVDGMQATASVNVDNASPIGVRIFQYDPNSGRPMFPRNLQCVPGSTIQLQLGTFLQGGSGGGPIPGGRIVDVTEDASWSTSNAAVAIVEQGPTQGGLVKCLSAGNVTISASYKGQSDSTSFAVSGAMLQSITVSPATATLANGDTRPFHAVGNYSDGSTVDLTAAVTWTSSNQTIASVSNATGFQGTVVGLSPGMSTIVASYQGVTGQSTLTVTNAHLVQIVVAPANTSVSRRQREQQFNATALYDDGTTQDVTAYATWGSTNTSVATISDSATPGLARLMGSGTTQISATYNNKTGTTTLTVF